jgi:hypothetical protein
MADRLEELWWNNGRFEGDKTVLLAAIEDLAVIHRGGSVRGHDDIDRSSYWRYAQELQEEHHRYDHRRRRLFARLRNLSVTIDSSSMQPLATLLSSVTRLSVALRHTWDDFEVTAIRACSPIATLPQLRQLRIDFGDFTLVPAAALRALHTLKQLRVLDLGPGDAHDTTDDDIAALLRALPRLVELGVDLAMRNASDEVLRVVGESNALLQRLTWRGPRNLRRALVNAAREPLFPCLEVFETWRLATDTSDSTR